MPDASATLLFRGTIATICLRILSFLLTQMTLRLVDPEVFGRAALRLELVLSTCLFLSREGFRLTFLKEPEGKTEQQQRDGLDSVCDKNYSLINISWLALPIGLVVSLAAMILHVYSHSSIFSGRELLEDEGKEREDYLYAGICYCIAAMVESCAEPLYIQCIRNMNVTVKAKAEGVALILRALSTVMLLRMCTFSSCDYPVSMFGLSQVLYACTYTSFFYILLKGNIYLPRKNSSGSIIDSFQFCKQTMKNVYTFSLQSVFKHLLTEGDRIVLTFVSGNYDQGIYAMSCNYGGVVSRMLFQPLEENARLHFAKLHRSTCSNEKSEGLEEFQKYFCLLLKTVLYVGFLFAFIGSSYTGILLKILAGSKWSSQEAEDALSAFFGYTALLALNGMSEAFVYAVSSSSEAKMLSVAHALFGCTFAAISPTMVYRYGTIGLIGANGFLMLCRSIYSILFAVGYFRRRQRGRSKRISFQSLLHQCLPSIQVIFEFIGAYFILRTTKSTWGMSLSFSIVKHILTGIFMVLLIAYTGYKTEVEATDFVKSYWSKKKSN